MLLLQACVVPRLFHIFRSHMPPDTGEFAVKADQPINEKCNSLFNLNCIAQSDRRDWSVPILRLRSPACYGGLGIPAMHSKVFAAFVAGSVDAYSQLTQNDNNSIPPFWQALWHLVVSSNEDLSAVVGDEIHKKGFSRTSCLKVTLMHKLLIHYSNR